MIMRNSFREINGIKRISQKLVREQISIFTLAKKKNDVNSARRMQHKAQLYANSTLNSFPNTSANRCSVSRVKFCLPCSMRAITL